MNLTNFKLIWRNLLKNAGITTINVFGLSVSVAVSTLIILFLQFEYSFDKEHLKEEGLYRLNTTFKYPNSPEKETAMASTPMGPYLKQKSPDVENYLRVVIGNEDFICQANGRKQVIARNILVDSTFFSFFDYKLLYGNVEDAFDKRENILLTRKVSEELFGKENPLGNSLEYTYALDEGRDTTIQFIVSAVFDDIPQNSHLQFESVALLDEQQMLSDDVVNNWHSINTTTYLQVRPSAKNIPLVEATFPTALKGKMIGYDAIGLTLQPISDIHLGSNSLAFDFNNFQKSNQSYLQILGLVALFILLISSINFANLSTVLAMRRVQEVGVRKSLGANKSDVLFQFLGEAVLMSFLGGVLALFWIFLLREPFLSILNRDIPLELGMSSLLFYSFAITLLGFLAGIFPAVQAAKSSAVEAFRKLGTAVSVKRPFIQRLVVLQFMLSGMLIIGSLICYQQLDFLRNKDLGFQYDQVVELNMGFGNMDRASKMKKELSSISEVVDISLSDASIGTIDGQRGVIIKNEETNEEENYPMPINQVNHNFFDLYEMKFVSGRAPTLESEIHGKEFVVNESFVKRVGWKEDPVGKEISRFTNEGRVTGRVVGVIEDVHHNTLHHAINAICFFSASSGHVLSLKIHPDNMEKALGKIEVKWNNYVKDQPFSYAFMDEHFAALYENESRLGQILLIATFLSILIACLGLLALSTFIIQQRQKEIGIRKILGASVFGIIGLLSKDFLKLVFIAFILASPFAWYLMDNWLQDFAYRIEIQWWIFALAAIASVVIAFITVSSQSLKAALNNPVDSLRNE